MDRFVDRFANRFGFGSASKMTAWSTDRKHQPLASESSGR